MKKLYNKVTISLLTVMALSSQSYGGGDILPFYDVEVEKEQFIKIPTIEKEIIYKDQGEIKVEIINKRQDELKIENKIEVQEERNSWYLGGGLTTARVSNDNCEDITYGVMAKVGYMLHENVALEARGIRTNWEYEGAKIKHFGVFLKPQYQIDEDFSIYGLLGYAKTTLSSKYRLDESGLAYGVGVDYNLGDKDKNEKEEKTDENEYSIFIDYERLLQKSNIPNIDAVSLGLAYKF